MSNRIIDGSSIFTGNDAGKDGIRKELGVYYLIEEGAVLPKVNPTTPYLLSEGAASLDETGLLPFYTQTLTINSASYAQNYNQWSSAFKSKFVRNAEYVDHYFNMPMDNTTIDAVNNYESYGYESLSKTVPPLSLLNIHDRENFPVNTLSPLGQQMTIFLDQFSIDRPEALKRQNLFFGENKITDINIGHINQISMQSPLSVTKPYNSFVKIKTFSSVLYPPNVPTPQEILFTETHMLNKIYSYFKRTAGVGLDFYSDALETMTQMNVKGFIDLISNYDLLSLVEEDDEKFYKDFPETTVFESQFERLQMLSKIRDFVKFRIRKTFKEILIDNDNSAHLILGYKIQKFRSNGNLPLQTVYIMTPKTRTFYDSLFSYDTNYRYEIKAITMVLGNSYSYTGFQEDRERGQMTMTFVNRPSLQFIEIPVLTQDMVITDIPTPPPEISFFNERGNQNEVIITLDQSTIVEHSSPDNYLNYFTNDFISQAKVYTQQKSKQIEFSAIYTSNIYQIYRMGDKPVKYSDFDNKLLTVIGSAGVESTDNLFRDSVVPHKKYYYLIRTLTNFGIHSNPTRIYEVELIQDSDETYINYKEFKFEEIQNTSTSKIFKKFLQIKPSLQQMAFKTDQITDLSTADNYGTNIVGTNPDPIWGRRFKIRVKSKKTGKKFDLNVTFDLKDENNQPI